MVLTVEHSRPNLNTLPAELQTQILQYVIPANVTIRQIRVTECASLPPESSTEEVHAAAYQAFYIISTPGKSDLAKKYPPPSKEIRGEGIYSGAG